MSPFAVTFTLLGLWGAVVAVFDWRQRRIPNFLSIGAWLMALPPLVMQGHTWLGGHWQGVAWGLLTASVLGFPAYATRKLGAGDVKLMLAMVMLGTLEVFLVSYAIAGFLSLLILMLHGMRKQGRFALLPAAHIWTGKLLGLASDKEGNIRIPFGALLGAGWLLALWLKA